MLMKTFGLAVATASLIAWAALAQPAVIGLVAAENFYGDIAAQIAGDRAGIASIMANPDQDPHLFETSPSVVREVAAASIVIFNGADYDPWMQKLLDASERPGRVAIRVADLVGRKPGDNPHFWYDPQTAPAVAKAVADALGAADPAHNAEYAGRLRQFLASLEPLRRKIAAIAAKDGGVPVTATEPVFGYMAAALKLKMRNESLQLAIMNDTEPGARDVAAFEQDLQNHKVRLLLYNKQASSTIVQHLVDLARSSRIPVVGVTETQPPGISYQQWMLSELGEVEKALAGPSS
jgi:zinc/manganese transport system substrate-binding protein